MVNPGVNYWESFLSVIVFIGTSFMVPYILDEVFRVLYSQPCPELRFSRPMSESKAGRSMISLTAHISDF